MKITCSFDKEQRSLNLEPEDDLEFTILAEIEKQTQKGQYLTVTKIAHADNDLLRDFRIELRLGGHQGKSNGGTQH